jgi:hypothetical protein
MSSLAVILCSFDLFPQGRQAQMKKIRLSSFLTVLKEEGFFLLIYTMFSVSLSVLFSFFLFDASRIEAYYGSLSEVPEKDQQVFLSLGIEGIAKQGHLIAFIFLLLILLLLFVLDAYLGCKKDKDTITIMRVKGFSRFQSQYLYLFWRLLALLFSFLFSLPLYILAIRIIDSVCPSQMPVLIFESKVLYIFLGLEIVYSIVNFPFYVIPYKNESLIKNLRENL